MPDHDAAAAWVKQCQQGDHEAFEALIREHQQMIHALTFRMTGSLDDSEDLAQETFIKAFQQINSFRSQARFSSWLYRIAVNTCLTWNENNRRRVSMQKAWSLDTSQSWEPNDRTRKTLAEKVQEVLLWLDAKQRAAIVLTVYDGLPDARPLFCRFIHPVERKQFSNATGK